MREIWLREKHIGLDAEKKPGRENRWNLGAPDACLSLVSSGDKA